jgi:hypothetical protein
MTATVHLKIPARYFPTDPQATSKYHRIWISIDSTNCASMVFPPLESTFNVLDFTLHGIFRYPASAVTSIH